MTETLRKPAVFSVDDPRLVVAEPDDAQRPQSSLAEAPLDNLPAVAVAPRRRIPWGTLFWSALSGLVLMALGLAITNLIEDLYARAPWLGAIGLVLALIAGLALLVVTLREIIGLAAARHGGSAARARRWPSSKATTAIGGRALVTDMLSLTRRIPRLARARARLEDHRADIIDGRDLVRLAERELMSPLDIEARRLVVAASKRVSVVTAISPRAAVDMVFVLINALRLVRQLAVLYGGRPGALGVLQAAAAGRVASGRDRRGRGRR